MCERKRNRPPGVERRIYGVMGCFYDDAPGFMSLKGSILTGGHTTILSLVCPGLRVATAIATPFLIRWPLNTPGPPGQLSAQFSCKRETGISLNAGNEPNITVLVLHVDSYLSDTHLVGTPSSYRSHCWSHRPEEGYVRNRIKYEYQGKLC